MGVLIRKQKGMPALTVMARLSLIGLIISLSAAFIDTIWAVYMDSFVNSEVIVGFISAGLTLIAFFSYFFFVPLIEKTNKSKIFSYSLFLFAVTYLLFAINKNFYIFIVLAAILTLLYTFRITSFGIIIRDKSSKSQLSRNEGLVYTFVNFAWVVGPLIAGYLSEMYGISLIFVLSSIFMFIAFFFSKFSNIKDANIKKKIDNNIVKNFKDFFKDKQRIIAYILSGGVNVWWILIYLFMPMHIIRSGLHVSWLGYFLFAVAVPLVLTECKFANIAGKVGFKKIFKTGFILVSIISLICFFVGNLYVILGLLVLASFGVAMLEPTTEAYFFDILKKKEDECRFYGPYNTTIDVHSFIAKVCASFILIFFPFKLLFLMFSGFMFAFFLLSYKVKDIIEKNRK